MNAFEKKQQGYLLVLVLVFGAVFFVIFSALMGFVISQKQVQEFRNNQEYALTIAEAGLNYYKWFLAHNPDDLTNGTGAPGPYVHEYRDPSDAVIGEYSLEVSGNELCGSIMSVDIESTGYTVQAPNVDRTLYARYARPTVAEYSYIINDNVWAGSDRVIIGPYHSNSIIRMDGTNNSTVSSGQETWTCNNTELSCNPPYSNGQTLDAVFGAGPNYNLWQTGMPPIDFAGITLDLSAMETRALSDGRHWGPSGARGYHIDFKGSSNTFELFRVNNTSNDHIITGETSLGTYSIPTDCPLIFVEDKLWLEGEVDTRVSVAAARVSDSYNPDIILVDNLTYTSDAGGLLAVGENDVLIGIDVPNVMEVNGIFVAQEGHFGREWYSGTHRCKDELTINGTIVSKGSVGTKWTGSGCTSPTGSYSSGFAERVNSFDRKLVDDPPPLAPETSDTYRFIEWREVD